jgi:predicted ATPase
MAKLIVLCGDFAIANKSQNGPINDVMIYGQRTETGAQMVQRGLEVAVALVASKQPEQVKIFTNSELFFYGIRLALKRKLITPDQIDFLMFNEHNPLAGVRVIATDAGRFLDWPKGFFDGFDEALNEMLD